MEQYDHKQTEIKWQQKWEEQKLYKTENSVPGRKNYYCLVEYPYPSGNLHIGHWYAFAVPDIFARYKKMSGYNVMFPFGFDSFGLPAENAAIKRGLDPKEWTNSNIDYMVEQVKRMGNMFDWSRRLAASDPEYYKWTQWLFLQLYAKGLATRKTAMVNWCPNDQTVLANEQVINGRCERCDTEVVQKELEQWFLKITEYADRLLEDLEPLKWPEEIKQAQRNWIGKSEGAELQFKVESKKSKVAVDVFTTRPDTLFGATYLVLAPEHKTVQDLKDDIENWSDVEKYITEAQNTKEIERTAEGKEKTGVKLEGIMAINPATQEEIPVYIADYVLAHYGTGAIMAVPAHDERDFAFATKHGIEIRQVVMPTYRDPLYPPRDDKKNVPRNTVVPIVLNTKGEVLLLDWVGEQWTKGNPRTFPTGGVDAGEDPIEAAKREIAEETGYTNLKHIKTLPTTRYEGFVAHKDENRIATATLELFELEDETQQDIDPKELEQHVPIWMSIEEARKTLTHGLDQTRLDFALNDPVYTGPGILTNSSTDVTNTQPKTKYLIFDFDGVLAKTIDLHAKALVENEIVEGVTDLETAYEWIAKYSNGKPDHGKDVSEEKKQFYKDMSQEQGRLLAEMGVQLFTEFIDELKKIENVTMAIVSSGSMQYLEPALENAGLHFTHVLGHEDHHSKEHKVEHICSDWGIDIEDAYYITDAPSDVYELEKLLVTEKIVGCAWGHSGYDELSKALPTSQIIEHPYEIHRFFADGNTGSRSGTSFNGMDNEAAKAAITSFAGGSMKSTYKLRDWLVSRQRYWGCPIPIVYDPDGNPHPVPDEDLPWVLPEDVDFKLTGKSPLETSTELVERTERIFGPGWRPEVDTFDTFVDSSWYFNRYTDANNDKEFASADALKSWLPVNRYSGGAEHTTLHVLYSRFFHKALFDLGLVHEAEPYVERFNRGIILGTDGNKMSKSKGNVVDPEDQVNRVGADTVKMYLAFIGPYNEVGHYPYDLGGVAGIRRFLEKVWRLQWNVESGTWKVDEDMLRTLHQTIKKVGEDCEAYKFNTAISQLMILTNTLEKLPSVPQETFETLLKLLAPFAPHMTEEIWEKLGHSGSIHSEEWPRYDASRLAATSITWVIQVNGKVRGQFEAEPGLGKDTAQKKALALPALKKWLDGNEPKKIICVPDKLVNIVV